MFVAHEITTIDRASASQSGQPLECQRTWTQLLGLVVSLTALSVSTSATAKALLPERGGGRGRGKEALCIGLRYHGMYTEDQGHPKFLAVCNDYSTALDTKFSK